MIDFDYLRPKDLKAALELLEAPDTCPIAGGTNLLVDVRAGLARPHTVVDIGFLDELGTIAHHDGLIEIGPCLTMAEIGESPVVQAHAPILCQAALSLGGPQIRNRATIGGNIVSASPAADSVVALVALGAEVTLQNAVGMRTMSLEDFLCGPGQTQLRGDELLTRVSFKTRGSSEKGLFHKFGRRNALAISVVNLAIMVRTHRSSGKWRSVHIALGAVAPKVIRARKAEALLSGQRVDEKLAIEAGRVAASACSPISDIRASAEYRRVMVEEWVARGIIELSKRSS